MQFLNVTYNLLTKFLTEKISAFNFLTWYKVQTYTGDTHWQLKLIIEVIELIAWLRKKMGSYLSITHYPGDQSNDDIYCLLLSWAIFWSKFQRYTICGIWDSRGWVFAPSSFTNHVYKKSFLYKGVKVKCYFNLLKKVTNLHCLQNYLYCDSE